MEYLRSWRFELRSGAVAEAEATCCTTKNAMYLTRALWESPRARWENAAKPQDVGISEKELEFC